MSGGRECGGVRSRRVSVHLDFALPIHVGGRFEPDHVPPPILEHLGARDVHARAKEPNLLARRQTEKARLVGFAEVV